MLPEGAWPVWTGSNHDGKRLATRWAGGDPARTRAALLILLGLRGTPFLYYGDEIGLPDTPLDPADALDPVAARLGDPEENRDVCRTPMQWADEPGGGFTADGARPWLPFGDLAAHNVEAQRDGPGLGPAPRARPDRAAARRARTCAAAPTRRCPRPTGAWAWRRGVGHGRGGEPRATRRCRSRAWRARVLVGTDRARDGAAVAGALRLGAGRGRRGGAALVSVAGLDELLSEEGWPYASTPPVEAGRPGALPRAVRARLADHARCRCCPSARTWRARRCARWRGCRGARSTRARSRSRARSATSSATRRPRRSWSRAGRAEGPFAYYGTADATSWFLVLLAATGDRALADELAGAWRAAGELARGRAASAAAASCAARPGTWGALTQQGWRDAIDPVSAEDNGGILRPDGTAPASPLADVDSQAAAHAALRALARLSGDERWERLAAELRERLGALGPGGDGGRARRHDRRRARARSSAGCCGRTRSTGPAREAAAARLCEPDVLTASACARCRASRPCSGPACYHRGSVWPFDSWIGWGGLRAAGRADEAERVRTGVLAALEQLGRAPELYAVARRRRRSRPSRSPTASRRGPSGARWALRNRWDGRANGAG